MTKDEWLNKAYITPYKENMDILGKGFDCYGLIKNYYKNIFGIKLTNNFYEIKKYFVKKFAPQNNGDILILHGEPVHAVLYWGNGLCFHITKETVYPVFERITSPEIKTYRSVYAKKR